MHPQLARWAHACLLLQVLTALHLIVGKIRGEPNVSDSLQTKDGKAMQLRLLVHSQLCGSILGKAGATIKSFAEDSRAQITVSPQDRIPRGATDRIVRIAGGPRSWLSHPVRNIALPQVMWGRVGGTRGVRFYGQLASLQGWLGHTPDAPSCSTCDRPPIFLNRCLIASGAPCAKVPAGTVVRTWQV